MRPAVLVITNLHALEPVESVEQEVKERLRGQPAWVFATDTDHEFKYAGSQIVPTGAKGRNLPPVFVEQIDFVPEVVFLPNGSRHEHDKTMDPDDQGRPNSATTQYGDKAWTLAVESWKSVFASYVAMRVEFFATGDGR